MKREPNTGIIIGITAAAVAVSAIVIAALVFVLPIVKEKCTDFYVNQKLEQGYKYLSRQDYKPAIAAFNTVVKVDDKRTEAYIGLGDAYSGRKDWVPAANYYSLAIDKVQNSADSIESASFANDYLKQSGSRVKKGGKNGLSASSINNHSGNTSIIVNQDLLQVLVDKRNNAIDCGREKVDSTQGCSMKPAEESVVVEGPDSDENPTSDDIPAQQGGDPSEGISTADDLYPSDDIVIDDEIQSGEDAETGGDIETDDDELSCENDTNDQVEEGAIKEEPSSANGTDQADEENNEDFDECTNGQPYENADDIDSDGPEEKPIDNTGELPDENADDNTDSLPDDDSEDDLVRNEQNALKPYTEVIDKLKEEHGEIRMTKSIQDPDDPAIAELNGVCLLTLLDMDGMGEKELFAVCKNDTDTVYKGIIYTIKDNKAVAALEIGNTAASRDGYDYTVCIHRYNNRDYILSAEGDESGSYTISGYIGDKYTTVEYSYEAAFTSEEDDEELNDPEESEPSADDEEADNDEDSGDWDDTGDEEESYNDEDSEDWDQSYEDQDAYNDEESEDWTEAEDVDASDDEESEDWDESYDSYDEDTYDVTYRGGKAAFTNCSCRVDPKSHKAINCTANDGGETLTYNYYINNKPVDEAEFTQGLAGFGLSMSGPNGEENEYCLAGTKEYIQLQTLTNLISDTETEIRQGMKMS